MFNNSITRNEVEMVLSTLRKNSGVEATDSSPLIHS